ncbi:DinB family protein [Paludibaculum fermentans]|uniref:DinB family protein n=1 Tax=Paludibaculum fermentans TaxID=1473598 RepID=UPI003EBBBC72
MRFRAFTGMGPEARGFDLARWLDAAAAIETELIELTTDLTEAQFHAPPRTGGWSIGHCIEHLILAGNALLPELDAALRRPNGAAQRVEQGRPYSWWQRKLLRYAESSGRLKLKTHQSSVPYLRRSINQTMAGFRDMHRELTRRACHLNGFDNRQARVRFPFAGWVRLSLAYSFDFVLAHERRHLHQAARVRHQLLDLPPRVEPKQSGSRPVR